LFLLNPKHAQNAQVEDKHFEIPSFSPVFQSKQAVAIVQRAKAFFKLIPTSITLVALLHEYRFIREQLHEIIPE
jgi:hypothetical protein